MPSKKVVVITGGAGFIGSHLCDYFVNREFEVVCVDNLITGELRNVAHHRKNKNFKYLKQDISKGLRIPGKVDYVLHFASPASPVDYFKHPLATMMVGSQGTYHCLELAKTKKAVFFMASTSEVYGDPLEHPQKESYWGNVNPNGVRSVYDEAKRFSEAMTFSYLREYKVDTKTIRIFNTYGPRMQINDGRVVPNFIDQIHRGQPLTIYGDGQQTRSFCYVSDLVDGIMRVLFSDLHGPVNLGNPREFTILEFAKLILKISNSNSKLIYKPLPKDDPKQRRPDITLARTKLGWEPKIQLEEGIQRTMQWFVENKRK